MISAVGTLEELLMADDLEPAASGRDKVMKNGNAEIDYAFAGDFTPLFSRDLRGFNHG
jgi:hypothetical protein